MKLDELTIGEAKQLASLFQGKAVETEKDHGTKIVILQRGWVAVGRYIQCGEYITLKNAAIVRKWGTTQGLPELARKGPLADTVLDKGPDIRFHALTEVASISCEEAAWQGKLVV